MANPYFNPGNPFDTGRSGEENSEQLTRYLQAGRQQELIGMGWDPKAPLKWHDNPASGALYQGNKSGGGGGGGTGIPGGALIAQAQLAAKQRYQQRLAGMNKQRQGVARTGGYKMDVSDDGLVKNWRVDPYNQYGQFQLLNRAQATEGQNVAGANLDRGLGAGGGLAAQNLNDARFGWGQQDAALGQSLVDQLGRIDEDQQGAKYEMDQSLWQLQLQALQMASQDGDYGYGGGDWDYGDDGAGSDLFTSPVGADFSGVTKLLNKKAKAKAKPLPKGTPNFQPKPKPKAMLPKGTPYVKLPKKGGKK